MHNPFRDPMMRKAFDECVAGYSTRHKNFYHADGSRNMGNSVAGMFWRGVDNTQIGTWDAASKKIFAYAYWRAGRACASVKNCYQCDKPVAWLAPDSRCGDCTRLTPDQINGASHA